MKCRIPLLQSSTMNRIKTCKDNSFFVKGPKLFNCVPQEIREFEGKLNTFKQKLDKFLRTVPDQPGSPGPEYARRAATNSLIDQVELRRQDVLRGGCTSSPSL